MLFKPVTPIPKAQNIIHASHDITCRRFPSLWVNVSAADVFMKTLKELEPLLSGQ